MNSLCVIVIPVHSENPSEDELCSLKQCFKVLGHYPIYLVAPEGLNIAAYSHAVAEPLKVKFIAPHWQSSLEGYNKLKTSLFFYKLFSEFKYMLTYELDAFVFRDELLQWCEKGYDYIGAPWFEKYAEADISSKIVGVGNSGFSLRNIQRCIEILEQVEPLRKLRKTFYTFKGYKIVGFSSLIYAFNWSGRLKKDKIALEKVVSGHYINEDYFWCSYVPKVFDYKIASSSDAIKFSFEVNAEALFNMNNRQLPFGCHAWNKYSPAFWEPFIGSSGETIVKSN
jgi:hypothetical protein